ncbi:MAG: DM13 domain-containing protein [Pacificimonas sp.]
MKNSITYMLLPLATAVSATIFATVPGVPLGGVAQAQEASEKLASGSFKGADRAHQAAGDARIVRLQGGGYGVKFESNFDVTGGPDLRVWVSEAENPRSKSEVKAADYIDLGRLQDSDGEQIYRLPDGFDLADADSIVIWCRAFGVFFGAATLS